MARTNHPPLPDAVVARDEKAVAWHIAKHPDHVHRQDSMGFAPLHWAADQNHAAIALMLLAAGASPDIQDMGGYTPLHFAVFHAYLDCAEVLIPVSDLGLADFKGGLTAREHARNKADAAARVGDLDEEADCRRIANMIDCEPSRKIAEAIASATPNPKAPAVPQRRI